ncbi:MAG TPA: hypothetical protein VIV35_04470, partial [Chitinophagaceae bacterium]
LSIDCNVVLLAAYWSANVLIYPINAEIKDIWAELWFEEFHAENTEDAEKIFLNSLRTQRPQRETDTLTIFE